MARDRAARKMGDGRPDLSRLGREAYLQAVEEEVRRERLSSKTYMQPIEATWREFLQYRGWTPDDVAELPDDWLYAEWGRYRLRAIYGIDNA